MEVRHSPNTSPRGCADTLGVRGRLSINGTPGSYTQRRYKKPGGNASAAPNATTKHAFSTEYMQVRKLALAGV